MPTLDWIGKKEVVTHHKDVPFRLLKCNERLSVGNPNSGNMLIQGDNLEALKALLPYYKGKIKCIYIDPPYNTGNENWMYNDNVNSPYIRDWLGKVVGNEDLSRHDKWLCMMYPRLVLLRELLSEDGSIFVSIDYNEEANLRLLLDEIFGYDNYRNTFIVSRVKKNIREREKVKSLNFGHNSVIFYACSEKTLIVPPTKNQEKQERWHAFDAPGIRKNMEYELFGCLPPKGRHWMFIQERTEQMIRDGLLCSNPKTGKPQYKLEASNQTLLDTNWTDLQEAGFIWRFRNGEKNVDLIKRIISMVCNPNDLILDSFSGSGTTGNAVIQMNKEDGGNRKFILIEMEQEICQHVTTERLKRVITGYETEDGKVVEGLSGGFRYFELGDSLFTSDGRIRESIMFAELARHVFFCETNTPLPEPEPGNSPLLGIHNDVAVYLLYNGILQDKAPNGGNVLTRAVLRTLPPYTGINVIYGTSCRLSPHTLKEQNIIFRQIPYEVKIS